MEWTETPRMNNLGSLYEYENTTISEVIGAGKHKNDAVMYSAHESSCTFRYDKGNDIESKLRLS